MRAACLLTAALLSACTGPEGDDTGDPVDEVDPTAPLAELSDGQCPDFAATGATTFSSGGVDRTVRIYRPEGDAEGLPVLFVWHPLGVTASQIASWLGLAQVAEDQQAIVVVPSSRSDNPLEWDFWNGGTSDLTLYDDLRTCLVTELGADTRRFATTGMSAGGLWTTHLTMHRADTLATSLVMSGGIGPSLTYVTPSVALPVLVMWGGPTDTYGNGMVDFDFDAASRLFAAELKADGHFVVECEHTQGHTIPLDGVDAIEAWLPPHVFGEPSPFEDGDIGALPAWCQVGTIGPE